MPTKTESIEKLVKSLISKSEPTKHHSIRALQPAVIDTLRPTIILLFGPSTVGKDTIILKALDLPFVSLVQTATSRPRRPDEDESAYLWLRLPHKKETIQHYIHSMVTTYSLVEWDIHNRYLYGIPRKNIEKSLSSGVAIIKTNFHGAKVLKTVLSYTANVLVMAVHPESWKELEERIVQMRKRPKLRIHEAIQSIEAASEIADYLVINSFKEGKLEQVQNDLLQFFTEIYEKRS